MNLDEAVTAPQGLGVHFARLRFHPGPSDVSFIWKQFCVNSEMVPQRPEGFPPAPAHAPQLGLAVAWHGSVPK